MASKINRSKKIFMNYKVLHICESDVGGAGIAASRLNHALQKSGIDSRMLVINKRRTDKSVFKYLPSIYSRIIGHLPIPYKQNKYCRFHRNAIPHYEITTYPEAIYDISKHPLIKEADIINLHWLGNMLNYHDFFHSTSKPIVWTLHDMNPFLGCAHYMGDVMRNPDDKFMEERLRNLKENAYKKCQSITVVELCPWMQKYSSQSNAFKDRQHVIIPNSIDTDVFRLRDRLIVRNALGLPTDTPLIMFCCQDLNNRRKGFDLLINALPKLKENCQFVVVGNPEGIEIQNQNMYFFGTVSDELLLSLLYSSADLFVIPSREDNLPNTMLESLCCGTPVLSFSNGGMADTIIPGINGILVDDQTSDGLIGGIELFFKEKDNYSRYKISTEARQRFSPQIQAAKYDKLYQSLL